MIQYHLKLQLNYHPRDYVYEVSTFYLTARSLHFAIKLGLPELVPVTGIPFSNLASRLQPYNSIALKQLIEFLALYQFFSIQNNIVYHTAYSKASKDVGDELVVDELEWNRSYDILQHFKIHPNILQKFSNKLTIVVENNSISYNASTPEEILMEISQGHLISRCIRILTTSGLVQAISQHSSLTVDQLLSYLHNAEEISEVSVNCLCILLSRYGIIHYNPNTQIIRPGVYLPYLLDSHPESIARSMHMITEPWWIAAAKIENSFLKDGESAFQCANGKSFYDIYINSGRNTFMEGMAAISLLEDQQVCDVLLAHLRPFETIIDLGGGDGSLLKLIQQEFPNKRYILFEKLSENCANAFNAEAELKQQIRKKYGDEFDVTVILGDFAAELNKHNLPEINNTAYIMKCVLHNIANPENIRHILQNIHTCMGKHSRFFLAERIVPDNLTRPHLNVQGNILMRLLFKAEARDLTFYKNILESADFSFEENISQPMTANNYTIFPLAARNLNLQDKPSLTSKVVNSFYK